MARIVSMERVEGEGRIHPTRVNAKIKIFGSPERAPVIQIDTFGSQDRAIPGKVSQTIQFDEHAALQLFAILKEVYRFK